MTYTAIFRDGPLGGQTRAVDRAETSFLVPVMPSLTWGTDTADFTLSEPERYELVGGAGTYLEYRWVNPAAGLRKANQRLRDELAQAQARIANAQDALR